MLSSKFFSPASAASAAARPLSSTVTHPGAVADDSDRAPRDRLVTRPQHLQRRLLCGEARGQALGDDALTGVAVAQLAFGVEALEVAVTVLVDRLAHRLHGYQVDPDTRSCADVASDRPRA